MRGVGWFAAMAAALVAGSEVAVALPPHPRLILTEARMANVTAAMKSNPSAQATFVALKAHADGIIPLPPVARPPATYVGILDAAREVLDRLYSLVTVAR